MVFPDASSTGAASAGASSAGVHSTGAHAPAHAVIDAHVHVWDPSRLDYPWLTGDAVLRRTFLPADIDRGRAHADGDGDGADRSQDNTATTGMVFVQAGCRADQALDEARWVAGLDWPELVAIVADADLRSGDELDRQLDALAAVSQDAAASDGVRRDEHNDEAAGSDATRVRLAGVRHNLQDEPDERFRDSSSAALVDGLRRLAARGLTFDVCVRHRQLAIVTDLLEEVPELRTVLDHVGKPPVNSGIDSTEGRAWAHALDRLARLPLAHVKLSGLPAEASSTHSLDAHAGEFLEHALGAFGPERAMIGSDWPVSALIGATGTFAQWRARVGRAADAVGFDEHARAAIEGGTAAKFYGVRRG